MPYALRPRKILTHVVNEANELLEVEVLDLPGQGGASHRYSVHPKRTGEKAAEFPGDEPVPSLTQHFPYEVSIPFQNGPIQEAGVNGVTQEILLAIVADRLESFQSGPFKNENNRLALDHVKNALEALKARTRERQARGVEGKNVV